MDTVLIILSILGFVAILLAAYVATLTSRTYASSGKSPERNLGAREYRERSPTDRRTGVVVEFPLLIDDMVISVDRRQAGPDRRQVA